VDSGIVTRKGIYESHQIVATAAPKVALESPKLVAKLGVVEIPKMEAPDWDAIFTTIEAPNVLPDWDAIFETCEKQCFPAAPIVPSKAGGLSKEVQVPKPTTIVEDTLWENFGNW